jgi:hypothetical protein
MVRSRPSYDFTAFEIHKELVENEGYDPKSEEYYAEINKRIRVDFPHKFGKLINKLRPNQFSLLLQ